MSAASIAPAIDTDFEEVGDLRRTDRRTADRRALKPKLDPLFAATLVNQIVRSERVPVHGYTRPRRTPRAGIIMNVSA